MIRGAGVRKDLDNGYERTESGMFSFLQKLIFLAVCLVVVGILRGWFTMSSPSPDPAGGGVDINVSVNARKMEADVENVEQRAARRLQEFENAQPQK
jgi:hypothetical protein